MRSFKSAGCTITTYVFDLIRGDPPTTLVIRTCRLRQPWYTSSTKLRTSDEAVLTIDFHVFRDLVGITDLTGQFDFLRHHHRERPEQDQPGCTRNRLHQSHLHNQPWTSITEPNSSPDQDALDSRCLHREQRQHRVRNPGGDQQQ